MKQVGCQKRIEDMTSRELRWFALVREDPNYYITFNYRTEVYTVYRRLEIGIEE